MSDHTSRVHAAQNSRLQAQYDVERDSFLESLDAAPFAVTDFEARFIGSFFKVTERGYSFWTPARRHTCDEMRKKYGGRL
jgi:hypothetical protein